MGWIFALPWEHRNDFWVNVLAGVPFLFFDIVIITIFLPLVLRLWDDRRWHEVRRQAISQVLLRFRDVDDVLARLRSVQEVGPSLVSRQALYAALAEHAREMDLEIQTALPVLDPEQAQAVLTLHYEWKGLFPFVRDIPPPFVSYQLDLEEMRSSAVRLALAHRRLWIIYSPTPTCLEDRLGTTGMVLDNLMPVYTRLSDLRRPRKNAKALDWKTIVARDSAIRLASIVDAPAVVPLIHRGWLSRLRLRRKQRLHTLTADQTALALEQEAIFQSRRHPDIYRPED